MLKTKISFKNFFIFNSTFGPKESEEEKKILFYYPEVDKNQKLKDVGFVEALIKFTSIFSLDTSNSSDDVLSIKKTKTIEFFFQPEEDFWIVLVSTW
jgi:First Longin domain of INTU, CCZ1 and HPS4